MSDDAPAGPSIEVRRGHPTDEELAAVVAVVGEAYAREADAAVADTARTTDRWALTARGLRTPLRPELGWSATPTEPR